ncbi:MAG: hypothetical protein JWM34_3355 [Ilumatobacteraceae bacterium]|nr:hypothetical protein [Ilumatobacteraceae bacterium]
MTRTGSLNRLRRVSGLLVTALVAAGVVQTASPAHAAEPIFSQYVLDVGGPRGAVTAIGDSVMLGSALDTDGYGPSVSQMLVQRGWGPVRMVAGVGLQAGLVVSASNQGANMTKWVLDRRAEGWDTPTYMVSLGPNDIGNCNFSQACAQRDILYLVDAIGADREIWWSMITMPSQSQADPWNNALVAVAAMRPNLHLWNWPAALAASDIQLAPDGVHLPNGAEYRKKSTLMADDFTAQIGVSHRIGASAAIPATLGSPSEYVPLTQHRVYDSRTLGARPTQVALDLSAFVPAGTTAVSVNLTAVAAPGPGPGGYVTAYPCGTDPPVTSNVNFVAGQTRPNQAVVALGAGAMLCAVVSAPADLIVDLQGAFVPSGGVRLNPLAPTRLVDTRNTGRVDPLVVTMPAGAQGAVVNITAVNAAGDGYLVAYPCDGAVPDTSNLNFVARDAAAGSAYVPVGPAGTICAHANVATDVVVDLQGTFTSGGALRFQPSTPQRMLDTRAATGGWHGQVGLGQTVDVAVAPTNAQAVTGNLTMIQPGFDGYATAYGCSQPLPATSSVNASATAIVANAVTTATTGTLCLRNSVGSHLLFDTTGWWVP